jgi:hypothetical protein
MKGEEWYKGLKEGKRLRMLDKLLGRSDMGRKLK